MGNLTRDVETVSTKSGTAMAKFGLAVNNGKDKDDTLFMDVTVFGATADVAVKYLKKGNPVLVSGRLKQESWEDKNGGGKRSKITLTANELRLMGSKPSSGGNDSNGGDEGGNGTPF